MTTPHLIRIDRSTLFNPVAFIRAGWSIAEQDARALAFTKVDLNKVTFETMLRSGEGAVIGEEKLKRLITSGKIRLDAQVLQTLLGNQHLIPESWKSEGYIFFDGTVLHCSGRRYVLYLRWWLGEEWYCGSRWLDEDFRPGATSACLAS